MDHTTTHDELHGVTSASQEHARTAPRIDPYWNLIARTALHYSIPLLLFALCLHRGWVGTSRDFWVPLGFVSLTLAPATRWRFGRPLAHRDFQDRDHFPPTYALLPAAAWCASVNLLDDPVVAAPTFFATSVLYDVVLVRSELLCVYALRTGPRDQRTGTVVRNFSLPLWGYLTLALAAVHALGRDTPLAIAGASLASALPVAGYWLWRWRQAPPQRFADIRRAAVIGAGWSGIYAVKYLSEAGIDATCFETTDSLGGVWKYREQRPGGVCASTRVTSSKHFLHASDFPMLPSTPDFPHHSEVLDYLQRYVDNFGLAPRVRLSTRVVDVEPQEAGWQVVTEDVNGARQPHSFDAVVVCSGPHQQPNIVPSEDPLYRHFTGRIMHSAEYKRLSDIAGDQTVLVVGAGESSADIVAECVRSGARVHWGARSGQWFADRNMGPYPADHITTQGMRVLAGLFVNFEYLVRRFVARVFVNLAWGRGGHGIAQWLPNTPYLHQFLNKSRDGVLEVYTGKVAAHGALARIAGRQVHFAGEEEPLEVDVIILATGYRPSWPYLRDQPAALYKLVFHPDDPTLAFAGFARPIVGSIPSLSELQARWIAAVWSGATTLPNRDRRRAEVQVDSEHHRWLIRDSSALGQLVDQELYATELASRIGAHVHWLKLLLRWPKAFLVLLISPWAPFKYRLNDPDPNRRREALSHIIRELPSPRAPAYLLAVGVAIMLLTSLGLAAALFWLLPSSAAVAALAIASFVASCMLRLSESDAPHPIGILGKLRAVFPF